MAAQTQTACSGEGLEGLALQEFACEHQPPEHREQFGVDQLWGPQVGC